MIVPPASAATLVIVDPMLLTCIPFSIWQAHMYNLSLLRFVIVAEKGRELYSTLAVYEE